MPKVYVWDNLNWGFTHDDERTKIPFALCPKLGCNCRLTKSKESYSRGEYKYSCPKCGNKIVLDKSVEEKGEDFLKVLESKKFENAEFINLDGDLIRVAREAEKDVDYWADVKISKNRKGQTQIMILAGSKKEDDKVQLFLDPKNEKVTFDQNNKHPREVFAKVEATFKNSTVDIKEKSSLRD